MPEGFRAYWGRVFVRARDDAANSVTSPKKALGAFLLAAAGAVVASFATGEDFKKGLTNAGLTLLVSTLIFFSFYAFFVIRSPWKLSQEQEQNHVKEFDVAKAAHTKEKDKLVEELLAAVRARDDAQAKADSKPVSYGELRAIFDTLLDRAHRMNDERSPNCEQWAEDVAKLIDKSIWGRKLRRFGRDYGRSFQGVRQWLSDFGQTVDDGDVNPAFRVCDWRQNVEGASF